jgi:hypothetical protein
MWERDTRMRRGWREAEREEAEISGLWTGALCHLLCSASQDPSRTINDDAEDPWLIAWEFFSYLICGDIFGRMNQMEGRFLKL